MGEIQEPDSTKQHALVNWKANSRLAYAFIALSISPLLQDHHQKEGPICQVQLLQQALSVQCTKDVPLPKTTEKICTLIERAFAMGDIKADLLCCIALLHSLSDNFPHARSIISRNITALTDAAPYGSKDICLFLDNEQFLLENDH